MARETVELTLRRIADHLAQHKLDEVSIVFHGGEPLLAGLSRVAHAAACARSIIPAQVRVRLSLQTNGVLLSERVLNVLREHDVSVGVSVDGGESDHDRHRRRRNGNGSYREVARGLSALRDGEFRSLFGGLLCTIDLASDPIAAYEALLAYDPPVIDFLLPHGNWTAPPPGRSTDQRDAPYADWLIAIFDQWYGNPTRQTRIRLFEEVIHLCLGGNSTVESIGLSPVGLIVIETDGSIEQVDTLKSAYDGAAATDLNVYDHDFDDALAHPHIAARQTGAQGLCDQCKKCALVEICGAGYYPHRYRAETGYLNPSVYCADLIKLITHIRRVITSDLVTWLTH